MYVTNLFDGTVSVIETATNTVIDTITVGGIPIKRTGAYDTENEIIYVTNQDGTVSVIDTATNTVIDTITVGTGPSGIAYDDDNQRMYVANEAEDTVSVIDTATNTVIDTIEEVGDTPIGMLMIPKMK